MTSCDRVLRHNTRHVQLVAVPYVEYHRQEASMVQFEGAADQSRRQVCDALTARQPNSGYDYLEGRANQSVGNRAHERGTLPTGGLSSAAPRRLGSVPVDSRANAVLPQDTVRTIVEPVREGLSAATVSGT